MYINEEIKEIQISDIRKIAMKIAQYDDTVNLSIGEPEANIPHSVKKAMCDAILGKHFGYSPTGGIKELREEYSKFYNNTFEANYDWEECLVNASSTEAFSSFFRTVLKPNDEVILNIPDYPGYFPNVLLCKSKPVYINNKENNYAITAEKIEEKITDKTKVIVITHPNNPTGQMVELEEMDKIAKLLEKHDIYLLVDEVYASLCYKKYYSFARYHHLKDKIVIVTGFSKSHSMTGYRVGITLSSKELIKNMTKVTQYTVTVPATVSQIGALEAVKNHSDRSEQVKRYKEKIDYLIPELQKLGFEPIYPDGGIYIYVKYDKLFKIPSFDLAMDLIEKERVAVIPAKAFNDEYAFRISLGSNIDKIYEFIIRLKRYLENNGI